MAKTIIYVDGLEKVSEKAAEILAHVEAIKQLQLDLYPGSIGLEICIKKEGEGE